MSDAPIVASPLRTWLAETCGVDPAKAWQCVKATCFGGRQAPTDEQAIAFLRVCREYDLDPFLKHVHAFVSQTGGVQPIVGYDGWANLANSHPAFDGVEFKDEVSNSRVIAVTCTIFRKDRAHPTMVTEYLSECQRDTIPWKQWPVRMLRNKAFIQAARLAFSLAGILDPDEVDRIRQVEESPKNAREYFTGDGNRNLKVLNAPAAKTEINVPELVKELVIKPVKRMMEQPAGAAADAAPKPSPVDGDAEGVVPAGDLLPPPEVAALIAALKNSTGTVKTVTSDHRFCIGKEWFVAEDEDVFDLANAANKDGRKVSVLWRKDGDRCVAVDVQQVATKER